MTAVAGDCWASMIVLCRSKTGTSLSNSYFAQQHNRQATYQWLSKVLVATQLSPVPQPHTATGGTAPPMVHGFAADARWRALQEVAAAQAAAVAWQVQIGANAARALSDSGCHCVGSLPHGAPWIRSCAGGATTAGVTSTWQTPRCYCVADCCPAAGWEARPRPAIVAGHWRGLVGRVRAQ